MKPTKKKILCNYCYLCIKDNENHYCNKQPKTTSNGCFMNIWHALNYKSINNNINDTKCEIPNLTKTHL